MHTFISRTIIIVIPLSMRQSLAVVVIVIIIIVIGIVIGSFIIVIIIIIVCDWYYYCYQNASSRSNNVVQKSYSTVRYLYGTVRSRGDQYYYGWQYVASKSLAGPLNQLTISIHARLNRRVSNKTPHQRSCDKKE